MSETSLVKRSKVENIVCNKCDISFSFKKALYAHQRRFHPNDDVPGGNNICSFCNKGFFLISKLHEHLTEQHNVTLHFEKKTFYCDKEFQEWKRNTEKETLSSFIRNSNYYNRDGIKYTYYICHRSGVAHLKTSDRKRRMKATGSIKSGYTCPAHIQCSTQVIEEACEIQILYQSVHIGHEIDVRKLPLPKEDRASLALSLSVGVPLNKILDQTRQNPPSTRISFLKRKDLHNVCRDMGIRYVCTDLRLSSDEVTEVPSSESDVVTEEPEENIQSERDIDVSVSHDSPNVQDKKKCVLKTMTQLRRRLHKINSSEVLEYVENNLNALNTFLNQFSIS